MARTSRILLTAFVIAAMAIGALVYLSVRDRDSTTTAQPDTGEADQDERPKRIRHWFAFFKGVGVTRSGVRGRRRG